MTEPSISLPQDSEPRILLETLREPETIVEILRSVGVARIFDPETLVCLDEAQCVRVMEQLIQRSAGKSTRLNVTALRWFRALIMSYYTAAQNRHNMAETQKLELAKAIVQTALMLFLAAKSSPGFIGLLAEYSVLAGIDRSSSIKAVAKLICSLFKRPFELPDSWLSRASTIALQIVNAAAATTLATRPSPELGLPV